MGNLHNDLNLSPTIDNRYIVETAYTYRDTTVPVGYKTNGANIPRILWFIIPPFKPKYLPAVVIHDYLCDLEEYKLADIYFEEILLSIEDNLRTRGMVYFVRLYHKYKYNVI